jgi:hypothetical protein
MSVASALGMSNTALSYLGRNPKRWGHFVPKQRYISLMYSEYTALNVAWLREKMAAGAALSLVLTGPGVVRAI